LRRVLTSEQDKIRIMEIIERKCKEEQRSDFEFVQMHYSRHKGALEAVPMNLLRFESS